MEAQIKAKIEDVCWNEHGLAPVVVQDVHTGQVLVLAYVSPESLRLSLTTGETWFYSRKRQQLWHKGETSGNTQRIVSTYLDCDGDALLFLVEPAGPACHTGAVSCFFRDLVLGEEAQ